LTISVLDLNFGFWICYFNKIPFSLYFIMKYGSYAQLGCFAALNNLNIRKKTHQNFHFAIYGIVGVRCLVLPGLPYNNWSSNSLTLHFISFDEIKWLKQNAWYSGEYCIIVDSIKWIYICNFFNYILKGVIILSTIQLID